MVLIKNTSYWHSLMYYPIVLWFSRSCLLLMFVFVCVFFFFPGHSRKERSKRAQWSSWYWSKIHTLPTNRWLWVMTLSWVNACWASSAITTAWWLQNNCHSNLYNITTWYIQNIMSKGVFIVNDESSTVLYLQLVAAYQIWKTEILLGFISIYV